MKRPGRRRFLKEGVALAGLAVAGPDVVAEAQQARVPDTNSMDALLYGQRSRFVTTVRSLEDNDDHGREAPRPTPFRPHARTPLGESAGIITPTSLHFTTTHNWGIPDINPSEHRLMVKGLVERPLVFTLDELKRMPSVSRIHFIECIANAARARHRTVVDTHGRTGCSEWTGVPVSVVLQEAGLKNGASWVIAEGSEGGRHTKSVPLAKCLDDCLLVYAQNGEPVRPDHGYPLRLLVPGFEGLYQVKYLRTLKVVDQPYFTFEEQGRYISRLSKTAGLNYELGPKSVITFPSGEHRLPGRGFYNVTGLAWSGSGAIRRVEVSTDGGRTWNDAQIQSPVMKKAHTRFNYSWNWTGGEAELQSRCTDELDQVQPSEAEFSKFWGFTEDNHYAGMNALSMVNLGHVNFIQPWKVNSDGSVRNGLQM